MKEKTTLYTKKVRKNLLFIQLTLLFLPCLTLFSISTDNGKIPASLCYFFSLVFLPYLFLSFRRLRRPKWYLTAYILFVLFLAILRIPTYGLSKGILHWLFAAYLLLVILNVGGDLSEKDWAECLDWAVCLFAVCHFGLMLLNAKTVGMLLSGYYTHSISGVYGALLPSLTQGGRNLDASWLAMGGLFVRGRKKAVYITYVLLFAVFAGSRAGLIAGGLLVLWTLLYDETFRLKKAKIRWYALYAAGLLAVLVFSGMLTAFLGRVNSDGLAAEMQKVPGTSQTAPEPASPETEETRKVDRFLSGRAEIWALVPKALSANPFGYGVGNAMRVLRSDFGFASDEDVVHNVLLQLTLDEGILGGLAFLALAAAFLWGQRKNRFRDPASAFLIIYLVLSLFQFHGGEALMWFVVGVWLLQNGRTAPLWPKKPAKKTPVTV